MTCQGDEAQKVLEKHQKGGMLEAWAPFLKISSSLSANRDKQSVLLHRFCSRPKRVQQCFSFYVTSVTPSRCAPPMLLLFLSNSVSEEVLKS
ncbi:hypothetical protein LR48_Vigan03g050400 [Vigna angularis]|uniref:Uncharacterized protein n=1 Tax=Phaseolus angularis TaxID=3914 RepID=A0A0L9U2R2_PHAAN|nr:hypothetical protein LR48_Vigan03g050400 [Vigna angularis]